MEIGFTFLVFFAVFVIIFIFLIRRRDLPPGPFCIPLLGSVWFLWKNYEVPPHKAFTLASKSYGHIMSIWIGPKLFVILNGFDAIRKAFVLQRSDFNDRPYWIKLVCNETKNGGGIIWSNGEEWTKTRKFAVKHLRSYRLLDSTLEDSILEEIDKVTTILRDTNGTLVHIHDILQAAAGNITCGLLFGQKFDNGDETFKKLLHNVAFVLKVPTFGSVINFIPEFMYPLFPKENELYKQKQACYELVLDFFQKQIKSHEDTFDEDDIRDFFDFYIKDTKDKSENTSKARGSCLNKDKMYRVIYDLLFAGQESMSASLRWCILYFIEFPDVQDKCRKEIEQSVGDRNVQWSDRIKLPYIQATVKELLRLGSIVPLGVPRTNENRDIYIDGFRIPRGTVILSNLYSAHVDSYYWTDPLEFNPDRFLNKDGLSFRRDSFIPLSMGPRRCPGESIVDKVLFLFISVLLQRFSFERDGAAPPSDFSSEPDHVITLVPSEYKVKVKPI